MDEEGNEYRWETGYEKTWESISEDADGGLLHDLSVQDAIARNRRKRLLEKAQAKVRLGMMRHLFVVLDLSECMATQDLKPTRLKCAIKVLQDFAKEFFYLNPISQMGLITTRDKRAEIWSEMAGNPRRHADRLKMLDEAMGGNSSGCKGEPSLQNALDTALTTLKHLPSHASREVVIVMGSLTTCDPGDIETTIAQCKQLNIRCSVISLAAEVRILKELTKSTNGIYGVILDDCHFKDLLYSHLEPPPSAISSEASLIRMGFPCHSGMNDSDTHSGLGLCMCHLDAAVPTPNSAGTSLGKLSSSGFLCPQCHSKYCELPVECRCCGLTLVSAPHLASGKKAFSCPTCQKLFCSECDLFIHETLHSCPGCASNPPRASNGQNAHHRQK